MFHLSHRVATAALSSGLVVFMSLPVAAQTVGTAGAADPAPILWKDPGAIASRDLFWGAGSAERAPKGPFTFVERDSGGTQPKIVVTDANGETWEVKFGREVHAEVAANRFVWALGYGAEEMYFVKTGIVKGAKGLGNVAGHLSEDGNFMNARFRRRNPDVKRTDDEEWTLRANPFVGQKELSGFKILMTLVANWDIGGTRNTRVLRVKQPDGTVARWFAVTDLGATFGKMGGMISDHSKWNLAHYKAEGFVEKIAGDEVHLDYDGTEPGVDRVPLEHARWFAELLSQLTPEQVRRAFEAAGATREEIDGFSKSVMEKIAQLNAVVAR